MRKLWQLKNKIDIIQYYPSESATPYKVNDLFRYKGMPHLTSIYYELVDVHRKGDLNGLWDLRKSSQVFTKDGFFHGKDAKPPWKWVEQGLTADEKYSLWDNPAELADLYFEPKEKPFIDDQGYIKKMEDISDPD